MNKAVLLILDGYGEGKAGKYNAVKNANTPFLHSLREKSYSLLKTDSESVGLLANNMGGSEVGHMTIGAGRVVPTIPKLILDEIQNGNFAKNKTINSHLKQLKDKGADLHLIGLMSDKNIHSDINHLYKIVDIAKSKAKNIYIHFITDGRDSEPYDSVKYLKDLKNHIKNVKNCHILSVSGRFYAMDRENYMERTEQAFKSMFLAKEGIQEELVEKYIQTQHNSGLNDQNIEPQHVNQKAFKGVSENDCLFFFNFREDRLRQMVKKCEELNCKIITMSDVGGVNATPIYSLGITNNTLSEYLSLNGKTQIKISETTKYAHVTYFLNGGREEPFEKEDRVHVKTKNTNDYSKTPYMRAKAITSNVKKAMKKSYDAIIVNYSNPDMLGHTGNYLATVKSLEFLDKCVKNVVNWANKYGYDVLLTADHGNSEEMRTPDGQEKTSHTMNKVMCVVANKDVKMKKFGSLIDVAPTFLSLLGLENSKHFEGKTLIK